LNARRLSGAEDIDMKRLIARFCRAKNGSIAIMAATFLACIAGCSAFAVDLGRIYLEQRHLQSAVDLAAIEASRNLTRAEDAVRATLSANGFTFLEELIIDKGRYEADSAIVPQSRFSTPVPSAQTNAVRVNVRVRAPIYFGAAILGRDYVVVEAKATGMVTELVAFSIGSRLLSLNQGLANTLLSGLLGGSVNLSVMDYNALLSGDVKLLDFLNVLAVNVGLGAGTYEQLLNTNVSVGQVLQAAASAAQNADITAAVTKLLAVPNAASVNISLGKLIQLGPLAGLAVGSSNTALGAMVNVFDLIRTTAEVANGTNQAGVNLALSVPDLLSVSANVIIGERMQNSPWITVTDKDLIVRTAQTRIRLQVNVAGSGLLLGATVRVPVYIDIASAQARLERLSCGLNPATTASVRLGVKTGVVDLWIAEPNPVSAWTDIKQTPTMGQATLVSVPLLATIKATAHAGILNSAEKMVDFNATDIANHTVKTVSTTNLVNSLLSTAIGDLALDITVHGIGIGLPGLLTNLLGVILAPVADLVDPALNELLDMLGIGIGEADVKINGIRCDGSALAA
jgi:uncharacterized membrane protein